MFLTIIIILSATLLLIAGTIHNEANFTVETLINRPNNVVFDYVKHIKNQEKYSRWFIVDPNIKMTYMGTDGTVGFKAAWVSENKNIGVGEQEITKIVDNMRCDVEFRFEKPVEIIFTAYTTTEALSDNQTRVTYTFNMPAPFPMNIVLPFIKRRLIKDMNETMSQLKKNLED